MVYLIFKKVKTFAPGSDVPKRWLNLEKPKFVTSFKYSYTNMKEILEKEYGLRPEDKIIIIMDEKSGPA